MAPSVLVQAHWLKTYVANISETVHHTEFIQRKKIVQFRTRENVRWFLVRKCLNTVFIDR